MVNLTNRVKIASDVVNVLLDNKELAGLVGKTISQFFFARHEFTAEQKAQLDAHFDDLSSREARLQDEIADTKLGA